jgi:uncharacterized protein (TIGR00369 family)
MVGGVGADGRSAMPGAGGLPEYLRITTTAVGPGRLVCELPVTEELLNPFGAAHGGVVSALIDHALGAVCFPIMARGSWPATQEFKLNFLAPARPGPLVATASIVALSKRTARLKAPLPSCRPGSSPKAVRPPGPSPPDPLPLAAGHALDC